jgi:hypothetical protein
MFTPAIHSRTGAGLGGLKHKCALAAGENGWLVVGRSKQYTPTKLDVGHRLQLRVSVRAPLILAFGLRTMLCTGLDRHCYEHRVW